MSCIRLFNQAAIRAMCSSNRIQLPKAPPSVALIKSRHIAAVPVPRQQRLHRRASSDISTLDAVEQLDVLVQRRLELLQSSPFQLLRIRGVTFENRQELVQQLVPGQPLMFLKEPSNPVDPAAVEIQTLDGQRLGHVSRYLTGAFPLHVSFGSVYSVGETSSGTWGALVSCSPALHGLSLNLLPQSWQQQINFEQVLGQQQWQQLQLESMNTYQHHCAISSAHTKLDNMQLQVLPEWLFDHHKKEVELVGFIPVASPLAQLHEKLSNAAATGDAAAVTQKAVKVVSRVMHWTKDEGQKYVEAALQRQQMVEQQEWKLVGVNEDHCQQLLRQQSGES